MAKFYIIKSSLRVSGRHIKPGDPDDALEELNEKQIERLKNRGDIELSKEVSKSKPDNADKVSVDEAIRKLIKGGKQPKEIVVKDVSAIVGRKVKVAEYSELITAFVTASKVSVELVKPLFDLMTGEAASEFKDGDDWDMAKISKELDREVTPEEIQTVLAMVWIENK